MVHDGTPDPGTNELLEVSYRFGLAVVVLATGTEPPRRRLIDAWSELGQVEGALSGLWPEPHVPPDLAVQVRGLLDQLTSDGSIEPTVVTMDDRAVTRTAQQITSLAFALHQAVGAASGTP